MLWDWKYAGPVYGAGYDIALVLAKTSSGSLIDYHWYRKDKNGYWSHKRGLTAISNKDASGNKIKNPKNANRNYSGCNYSTFVGTYNIYKYSDF